MLIEFTLFDETTCSYFSKFLTLFFLFIVTQQYDFLQAT